MRIIMVLVCCFAVASCAQQREQAQMQADVDVPFTYHEIKTHLYTPQRDIDARLAAPVDATRVGQRRARQQTIDNARLQLLSDRRVVTLTPYGYPLAITLCVGRDHAIFAVPEVARMERDERQLPGSFGPGGTGKSGNPTGMRYYSGGTTLRYTTGKTNPPLVMLHYVAPDAVVTGLSRQGRAVYYDDPHGYVDKVMACDVLRTHIDTLFPGKTIEIANYVDGVHPAINRQMPAILAGHGEQPLSIVTLKLDNQKNPHVTKVEAPRYTATLGNEYQFYTPLNFIDKGADKMKEIRKVVAYFNALGQAR